jgi:hypothetical protein
VDYQYHYLWNSGLCWLIVFMALLGYWLGLRNSRYKGAFWLILIIGWGFMAISNSLLAIGVELGSHYLFGIWLSSFVMVIASIVLIFIKLIHLMKTKNLEIEKKDSLG